MSRKNPNEFSVLNQNKFNELCAVLGIKELSCYDPDKKVIERAFRKRALKTHPDKGGDQIEFKKINDAYYKLMGHISKLESQVEEQTLANSILIEISKAAIPRWIERLKRSYGWPKSDNCKMVFFEGPYKQFKGRSKNTGPITLVLYEDPPDAIPKIHIISAKYMAWIAEQMLPVHMHVEKGRSIQFDQWRIAHLAEFGICNFCATPAPQRKAPPAKEPKAKRKAREASEPRPKTRRDSEPTSEPPPTANGADAASGDSSTHSKFGSDASEKEKVPEPTEPKKFTSSDNAEAQNMDTAGSSTVNGDDSFPKLYNMAGQTFETAGRGGPKINPSRAGHDNGKLACGHCGAEFIDAAEYNAHQKKCVPDEDFGLTRDIMDSFKEHKKTTTTSNTAGSGDSCPIIVTAEADKKADVGLGKESPVLNLLTGSQTPIIRKKSPDEPAFSCPNCDKGFESLIKYTKHKDSCKSANEPPKPAKNVSSGPQAQELNNNQMKNGHEAGVANGVGHKSSDEKESNGPKSSHPSVSKPAADNLSKSHHVRKRSIIDVDDGLCDNSESLSEGKSAFGTPPSASKKPTVAVKVLEEAATVPAKDNANLLPSAKPVVEPPPPAPPAPAEAKNGAKPFRTSDPNKIQLESLKENLPAAQPSPEMSKQDVVQEKHALKPSKETSNIKSSEKVEAKQLSSNVPSTTAKPSGQSRVDNSNETKKGPKASETESQEQKPGNLDKNAIKLSEDIFPVCQSGQGVKEKPEPPSSPSLKNLKKGKPLTVERSSAKSQSASEGKKPLDLEAIKLSNNILLQSTTDLSTVGQESSSKDDHAKPAAVKDNQSSKSINDYNRVQPQHNDGRNGLDIEAIKLSNIILTKTSDSGGPDIRDIETFKMPNNNDNCIKVAAPSKSNKLVNNNSAKTKDVQAREPAKVQESTKPIKQAQERTLKDTGNKEPVLTQDSRVSESPKSMKQTNEKLIKDKEFMNKDPVKVQDSPKLASQFQEKSLKSKELPGKEQVKSQEAKVTSSPKAAKRVLEKVTKDKEISDKEKSNSQEVKVPTPRTSLKQAPEKAFKEKDSCVLKPGSVNNDHITTSCDANAGIKDKANPELAKTTDEAKADPSAKVSLARQCFVVNTPIKNPPSKVSEERSYSPKVQARKVINGTGEEKENNVKPGEPAGISKIIDLKNGSVSALNRILNKDISGSIRSLTSAVSPKIERKSTPVKKEVVVNEAPANSSNATFQSVEKNGPRQAKARSPQFNLDDIRFIQAPNSATKKEEMRQEMNKLLEESDQFIKSLQRSRPPENPDINKNRPSCLGLSRFEGKSISLTQNTSQSGGGVGSSSILKGAYDRPVRNQSTADMSRYGSPARADNAAKEDAGGYTMSQSASFAFGSQSPETARRPFDRNFNMSPAPFNAPKYSVHFSETPSSVHSYKSKSALQSGSGKPSVSFADSLNSTSQVRYGSYSGSFPSSYPSGSESSRHGKESYSKEFPRPNLPPARAKSEGSSKHSSSSYHSPSSSYSTSSLGTGTSVTMSASSSSADFLKKVQATKDQHRDDLERAMNFERGSWKPVNINVRFPRPGNEYNRFGAHISSLGTTHDRSTSGASARRAEREKIVLDRVLGERSLRSGSLESGSIGRTSGYK